MKEINYSLEEKLLQQVDNAVYKFVNDTRKEESALEMMFTSRKNQEIKELKRKLEISQERATQLRYALHNAMLIALEEQATTKELKIDLINKINEHLKKLNLKVVEPEHPLIESYARINHDATKQYIFTELVRINIPSFEVGYIRNRIVGDNNE